MKPKDVEYAYRKLKHTIYYDSTYSFIRSDLASFEQDATNPSSGKLDLSRVFEEICAAIKEEKKEYFADFIEKIEFWRLPKTIENNTIGEGDSNILTNAPQEEESIKISRDFKLIKTDIRLHLISVLWIMKGGYLLENEMKVTPYGNKLEIKSDKSGIVSGLRLFKPYHKLYKAWRDDAFKEAKHLISKKENVLLVSLDVKNYYPSVKLDFDEIIKIFKNIFKKRIKRQAVYEKDLRIDQEEKEVLFLTEIIKDIHIQYEYVIKGTKNVNHNVITGLPIGLHSSAVIGNWFLRNLDNNIRNTINPVYYARYVDDIMLVIANPYIEKKEMTKGGKLKDWIFKQYFIKNGIFKDPDKDDENTKKKHYPIESILSLPINVVEKNKEEKIYTILFDNESSGLEIQSAKSRFYYFDKNQPTALLDKIEREIQIESSEFRYLPDEKDLFKDFYSESHYLSFDGSVNKLRNVSGFGINLYGASKDLSKKIISVLQVERKPDIKAAHQLNIFFQGARAIETSKLWEKAATYFIATKDAKGLLRFVKNIINAINKVEFIENSIKKDKETTDIQQSLYQSLAGAVSMALALDTNFLNEDSDKTVDRIFKETIEKVIDLIEKYLAND